jgi:hypothetical protein
MATGRIKVIWRHVLGHVVNRMETPTAAPPGSPRRPTSVDHSRSLSLPQQSLLKKRNAGRPQRPTSVRTETPTAAPPGSPRRPTSVDHNRSLSLTQQPLLTKRNAGKPRRLTHFGRTVFVMCNVQTLITSGILRIGVGADEESLTHE